MFDAVRNNKRIVQVFLALITLPFAFFGVDSYVRNAGSEGDVATIGDVKVTQQQFQQALRDQQERLRGQMGGQVDPKLLDNPEARKAILNDLVDQRLLMIEARKQNLSASDAAIRAAIGAIDVFKVDGKFSTERYESALSAQGMSPAGFEAQLRQDLTLQQLAGGLGQSGLVARTVSDRVMALQMERREVVEFRLALDAYLDKVKLADGAAQKFYDENGAQFDVPEQARAEYVVLSMATIGAELAIPEAEAKAWYDGHKERFQQPEERRASHILIAAADKAEKPKAKARAEQLLAEIQKAPAVFADLAKKNSQDPGSAAKGGDLGFFGRGMMVKPFEDAAYGLKDGEISGVIESDFGFHIIKLTGIHAAKEKPFAEVKVEIEDELKKAGASRKFAEAAEAFSNMVYEQSDSLKPVAEKFKLTVSQSDWLGRKAVGANGPLANEKLLAALFSEDVVKNKRNTEAVETATNTLVAARILEHKPSARQPFEAVKGSIETLLKRQEAQAMARKDGEARLEALKKGEDKLGWGAAKTVSRLDPRLIPQAAIAPVFKLDVTKLPGYTGVEMPSAGYALFKLTKVDAGEKLDEQRRQAMLGQLGKLAIQEEVQTYLTALRSRYKVEINNAALEIKDK
jgi:peptidyl-prolyl cis-trans isomerase D